VGLVVVQSVECRIRKMKKVYGMRKSRVEGAEL
jgi:hypothetical protein